jgi:hypothetical protein
VIASDVMVGPLTLFDLQGDNWNDLLKEVVTFNSVEEFWGIYVRHSLSIPHPWAILTRSY